ncbi:hypothetical protein [Streptomyces sp. NPDC057616]|uniref:hypothetical protein n=1 Tax=Streptomyces sp. NPDC057616 TaxID=3346183 RepID=UPI0036B6E596
MRYIRSRPCRAAAAAAGAGALTAALLTTGCDGPSAASAATDGKAAFSAVRFTFGARGGIEFSGASRAAVTPAGSHPVTAGRPYRFGRPGDRLLVVLRHWPGARTERASRAHLPRLWPPDEPAVETGFLVDTAGWVRAGLDGNPLQWLRRDVIRVDATNNAAGDLTRLTLSEPHGRPVPPPATRACARHDGSAPRRAALPGVERGTDVRDALARLSALCLDVQYAGARGGGRPGTVRQVLVPLAEPLVPVVAVPSVGGPSPGRAPGDQVLLDPSRPATVVVAR